MIKDNKKKGLGKIVYENGDVYYGDWVDDIRDGKGKLEYKNGDVYEGDFFNNEKIENN